MTAQVPTELVNNYDEINLEGYRLYSVLIGEPSEISSLSPYRTKSRPDKDKMEVSTACWNGYCSTYELSNSGELSLIEFWYPFSLAAPDKVLEALEGDFWLDFREEFFSNSLYIPFKNGKIIPDRNDWVVESKLEKTDVSRIRKGLSKITSLLTK